VCGIFGALKRPGSGAFPEQAITQSLQRIQHRGPDGSGAWADPGGDVVLCHRRLSILDLSESGRQPMHSPNGRYVVTYNGELYNHRNIRTAIGQSTTRPEWAGHSDTETMLAAFDLWGVESALSRTIGMFAIAVWDRQERVLHLARDRFGEKPLYYGIVGGQFVFASELKPVRALPGFANPVSRAALSTYLRTGSIPAPRTIYEGLFKLPPGTWLSVSATDQQLPTPVPYWRLQDVVAKGAKDPLTDEQEGLAELERTLAESVQQQMLSDVPLGAFLSGGVDSSTIVALMQAQSSRPVKTFTIGFAEAAFDESPHAAAVAAHLGTEHHTMMVTAKDAQDVIPLLPTMYDEPFADSSQIPTHLVCRAAREHVTVALSGDAGDELFGGYNRYFWGPRVWNKVGWLPYPMRRALGELVRAVPTPVWGAMESAAGVAQLGDKAHKMAARLLTVRHQDDLYWSLVTEWPHPNDLMQRMAANDVYPFGGTRWWPDAPAELHDPVQRMMFYDAVTYLTDDILCKVDRAAMAVSLETRAPFLDHRVAELAWRLPMSMKIRNGEGKWALRQVLYKYVPRQLIERPKAGFGIPVGQWLRGPLREWAEALLDADRLQREGYLDPAPIRAVWAQHLRGTHDWTSRLWIILMFQAWLEAQGTAS
jgi:asparagine synthase (glutamine-hydrolysing)